MKNYNLGLLLILGLVTTLLGECNRPGGGVSPLPEPALATTTPFMIDVVTLAPIRPAETAEPTVTATATEAPTETATATPTNTATATTVPTETATPIQTPLPTLEPTAQIEAIVACEADGTETVILITIEPVIDAKPVENRSEVAKPTEPEQETTADSYPAPATQVFKQSDPDDVPERPPAATPTAVSD